MQIVEESSDDSGILNSESNSEPLSAHSLQFDEDFTLSPLSESFSMQSEGETGINERKVGLKMSSKRYSLLIEMPRKIEKSRRSMLVKGV